MLKLIFIAQFIITLFVTSSYAGEYLVTTQDREIREYYKENSSSYYEQGRLLIVTLDSAVNINSTELQEVTPSEVSYEFILNSKLVKKNEIEDYINNVSINNLRSTITHLSSFKSLAMGNVGNITLTTWLQDEFSKLGYTSSLDCFQTNACNVIAGQFDSTKKNIIVIAHFDTVGQLNAGADDNGSGVAGLLEMARLMSSISLKENLVFIAANGEEKGLLGSRAFVKKFKDLLSLTSFVINMDMIGFNKTNILDLETNIEFKNQITVLAEVAKTYSNLIPRVTTPAWGSDHVPFLENKIPAVLTIEDWDKHNPCYHKSCDLINLIDFDYMKKIVQINIAYLLER